MPIRMTDDRYGKAEVRVFKLERGPGRHVVRDLTVEVQLTGDFDAVHTEGDNEGLVATDTMRNVAYAKAAEAPLTSLPAYAAGMVQHFLGRERVTGCTVTVRELPWDRLGDAAFQRGSGGVRVHWAAGSEGGAIDHASGIEELLVLRSSGSGFSGFERDEHTTLPETEDRIMATVVTAEWEHEGMPGEGEWAAVRDTLLRAFDGHHSPSVQFTLHRMGSAVLEEHQDVGRIRLVLPNRHHLPFGVARFGLEERNEVFQPTTEPYGRIEATLERE
jgi:urate oxidase